MFLTKAGRKPTLLYVSSLHLVITKLYEILRCGRSVDAATRYGQIAFKVDYRLDPVQHTYTVSNVQCSQYVKIFV